MKNGYVVSCETTHEAAIIDPGDEVDALLEQATRDRARVTMILLTHAHLDHITGVARAKAALGVPVWLHPGDRFLYEDVVNQGRMFGLRVDPQPPVDHWYTNDMTLRIGSLAVDVRHTPGHCPGGVCLAIGAHNGTDRALFVGDTLFAGSIGRTDLPGGDVDTLLHSIRHALMSFPDKTIVYSGHGPATTIGAERRSNPFL
jgi:glyoxylase-like metal-dependent hydrolase (beta-lactamase superfamily II)